MKNRNEKCKKYDCDTGLLKYEGEYFYEEKHGKGKEYDDGKLIFEGEYLYDDKWKGKLYNYEKEEL